MRRAGWNETLISVAGFFAAPFSIYFILLGFGIELPPYRRFCGTLYLAIGAAGYAGGAPGLRDFSTDAAYQCVSTEIPLSPTSTSIPLLWRSW